MVSASLAFASAVLSRPIGRLTRDPESRVFSNGGKVTNFGFAVNNRRKNTQTGQWEDEPMFIDCKLFNRSETNPLADRAEQNLRKGQQVFLEGKLVFEQWEDKNGGGKRSKLVVVMDDLQFLDNRQDGSGPGGGMRATAPARQPQPSYASGDSGGGGEFGNEEHMDSSAPPQAPVESEIPF